MPTGNEPSTIDHSLDLKDVGREVLRLLEGIPGEGAVVGGAVKFGTFLFIRNATEGVLDGANFAQKTFGKFFSEGGKFAGRTVDDIAAAIKSGNLKVSDVPIDYIVRNGNTLILNTRSSQALMRAGIPRSQWRAVNRTGSASYEARLTGQLKRNKLTDEGISTVRQAGEF
ncbi:hypothetical protein ACL7TT_11075 [Microbulbifer sp. 2304DJ12-6]|uniref:hypothetical protein n=1 Tax=Microbulbifer sp. 2304DJ12-6 TaxID=3233340 RepID=UPI0039B0C890